MTIAISLQAFEGPLDLLLDLIKEKQVDIYDIPIKEITAAYLERLKEMEESELEVAGEFIVMAATLMEIKARMLLPKSPKIEEKEEDPREDLVNRLVIYRQFKELAQFLEERSAEKKHVFARDRLNEILLEDLRPKYDLRNISIDVNDLCLALKVVLDSHQKVETTLPLPREKVTIEKQMRWLEIYLCDKGDTLFNELFNELKSHTVIVVTFLALLELVHIGVLGVSQTQDRNIYIQYYKRSKLRGDADVPR